MQISKPTTTTRSKRATTLLSLGILSHSHIELINECALRWRISQPYRAACFLDLIKQLYERNEVPLDRIPEALGGIAKAEYLINVHGGLVSTFLASVYHATEALPDLKKDDLLAFIPVLTQDKDTGLLERFDVDIIARMQDIKGRVCGLATYWYQIRIQEWQSTPGVNRALPLLLMTDDLEKHAKTLDKRFPEPILQHVPVGLGGPPVDLVALLVEATAPLLEGSSNGPTPDVPSRIFSPCIRERELTPAEFDLGPFFEPYVRQWLTDTDNKTAQWVGAFEVEAEDADGFNLEWFDEYQEARFFTSLAKTISKAVEQYCRSIEELFMGEMFPRPTDYLQPQKSSAWLEKAKQLAQREKKIERFNFQPASCVKLNNVDSARKLLDNMYNQIQADKLTEVIETHGPPVPNKNETPRFLFSVKIVMAENLVPLDSSPSSMLDTFVILSDQDGHPVAKTRTIYETLSPRWDETFDVSVEKPLWLMVSVRDRALLGKHDTVWREYVCLDPMEGEKDDIQFYFGRPYRSLKRSEGDMVRIFSDMVRLTFTISTRQMSPFIRQSLSRLALKSLIEGDSKLDYNRALGNVTVLYRSALGGSVSEVRIPLPADEKPRVKPGELTDVEMEQAIVGLFDYFEANLKTLNTYLGDSTKEMVEILVTIEGLLIPPPSDAPSDMNPGFLRNFFYAGGEGPVPLESLTNQKYRDIVSIRLYYDRSTDMLMEECVRMMQQTIRTSPSIKKRAKSVYSQRNLGTIKDQVGNGETIICILRMRPNTSDFITQQLQILATMQAEQENRERQQHERKTQRPGGVARIPDVQT
ncbi:hypothetical protein BJV78DRAFT_1176690, partial [Lactifluus subvellereus]